MKSENYKIAKRWEKIGPIFGKYLKKIDEAFIKAQTEALKKSAGGKAGT